MSADYHTCVSREGTFLQERDDAKYNVIMHKANCTTYNFSCRAKLDDYNVRFSHHFCSLFLTHRNVGANSYTLRYFEDLSFELQRGSDGFTGSAPFCVGSVKSGKTIRVFILLCFFMYNSLVIVMYIYVCIELCHRDGWIKLSANGLIFPIVDACGAHLETFQCERWWWWQQLSSSELRIRRLLIFFVRRLRYNPLHRHNLWSSPPLDATYNFHERWQYRLSRVIAVQLVLP